MLDRRKFMQALGFGVAAIAVGPNLASAAPVVVRTRKLKAQYSPELVQDLQAYHGIDANAEVRAIVLDHVKREVGTERGTLKSSVALDPHNFTANTCFTFTNDGKHGPEDNWDG